MFSCLLALNKNGAKNAKMYSNHLVLFLLVIILSNKCLIFEI